MGATGEFSRGSGRRSLIPETGNLLVWSSGWPNRWITAGNGKTYTSLYDVKTGKVSDAMIQNTQHAMFCPGTSYDENGRIIVTGGSSAAKTSVLDFKNGGSSSWMALSNMQIQALSRSARHARPAKQMNWNDTKGTGASTPTGLRGVDEDSMCGVSVMYDAVAGKVFTYGGGQSYTRYTATSNADILNLGEPGQKVQVQQLKNGQLNRGFANAVVLPDGKVWVLFDPATGTFSPTAPHTVPRNYHSTALLMADGTVWSGGGGLCGAGCAANKFDGQFWSPPYLFQADGKTPAVRPVMEGLSAASVKTGAPLTVIMRDAGKYTFSMIRVSATTHTDNMDQRRIPLEGQDGDDGKAFTVAVPDDYGVAVPGYYMMFATNEAGVPCVAKFFQVAL